MKDSASRLLYSFKSVKKAAAGGGMPEAALKQAGETGYMLQEERFALILGQVNERGVVRVEDLKETLGISESTIRRDLTELDAQGLLEKVRGGAVSKESTYKIRDDDVAVRKGLKTEEKKAVASYASSLIEDDDFVYVDAGTTTEYLCEEVTNRRAVFVTNAIAHARALSGRGCRVFLIGGEFKAATEAIVGEEALMSLTKYNFTKGFFGTNGISKKKGFMTPEMNEAMVKRAAMASCKTAYVLADDSKFGEVSAVSFADFGSAIILTNRVRQKEYRGCKNIVEVMRA